MEVNGVNLPPLLQKLMYAYLLHDNVTDAGEHAANQILLRCDYLIFQGSASDLVSFYFYRIEALLIYWDLLLCTIIEYDRII